MQTTILVLGTALLMLVAYADVRTRRIPNELIVGLLALATLRIALSGDPKSALYTLVAGGTLFVAAFLLFWRGLVGGGDVKLIVATSFLIGYHDVLSFLFVMSLSGGLMAVAILAGDKIRLRRASAPIVESQETQARLTVPYGVAIAVAGIFTLFIRSFVPG